MKLRIISCLLALAVGGLAQLRADEDSGTGAVYTMDNAPGANNVLIFQRHHDGTLAPATSKPTGGLGTGANLGSQGAVQLSDDGHWLFVCNAGSDDITVFAVTPRGLEASDKVASGGRMPISLTFQDGLLYVLNAGGALSAVDNITGFRLDHGRLVPLPGSTRGLSSDNTGPAEVSFSADGDSLVVTEKATSIIDTFTLGANGLAEDHNIFQSTATTPFGFASGRKNRIYVSNADSSSLSSYQISDDGDLEVISDAVPNTEVAACWVALTGNSRFAYTANAGSGTLSGYRVDPHGQVTLLDPDGRTGVTGTGSHPIDMAFSQNSQFLYSLCNGNGTLVAFAVGSDGSLQNLGSVSGVSSASSGLAAQ